MNESEQLVFDTWVAGKLIRKNRGCDFEIEGGGLVEVKPGGSPGIRESQMLEMSEAHKNGENVYLASVRGNAQFIFKLIAVDGYIPEEEIKETLPAIRVDEEVKKILFDLKKVEDESYGSVIKRLIEKSDIRYDPAFKLWMEHSMKAIYPDVMGSSPCSIGIQFHREEGNIFFVPHDLLKMFKTVFFDDGYEIAKGTFRLVTVDIVKVNDNKLD